MRYVYVLIKRHANKIDCVKYDEARAYVYDHFIFFFTAFTMNPNLVENYFDFILSIPLNKYGVLNMMSKVLFVARLKS